MLKRHTAEEQKFISIPNVVIDSLPTSVTMNINWEKHREVGQQEVSNAGEIKNKYCGLKKSIFSFLLWNRWGMLIAIAVFNQKSAQSFFALKVYYFKAENTLKSCIPAKIKQADLFVYHVSESQHYPLWCRQFKKMKWNRFSCREGYSGRQIHK